jgi:hypothetical protein
MTVVVASETVGPVEGLVFRSLTFEGLAFEGARLA